jgi:tRNA(Ile)-lysidine synthase TilS/MesJ
MTVIRPLILTDEKDIVSVAKTLPVMTSKCPADKHTKRELIKDILKNIQKDIPIAKDRLFTALIHPERYNLLDKAYKNTNYWQDKKTPKI